MVEEVPKKEDTKMKMAIPVVTKLEVSFRPMNWKDVGRSHLSILNYNIFVFYILFVYLKEINYIIYVPPHFKFYIKKKKEVHQVNTMITCYFYS